MSQRNRLVYASQDKVYYFLPYYEAGDDNFSSEENERRYFNSITQADEFKRYYGLNFEGLTLTILEFINDDTWVCKEIYIKMIQRKWRAYKKELEYRKRKFYRRLLVKEI